MRKVFPVLLIVLVLGSCLKVEDFPDRPSVNYIGFFPNPNAASKADSLGFITFEFTDGDGDLGLPPGDTIGEFAPGQPYYYNLFVRYFEKQSGTFVEVIPSLPFSVRFETLTSVGGNGSIQGKMDVRVYANPASIYDTVRYEMYIVDRAKQHSDTLITEEIIFDF